MLHDAESAPEERRVVHLWHASSLVQERHLDALRRGLRAGGWQGAVEALTWPPEEENRQLGEILNGTSGQNSEGAIRTRFLGIYCGVAAAEALQFAHREGIPAAVMGPELRKAYPETVRFSLELEWYAALRKAVWRSLQGEELPPRQPVEGRIVTH
jgi:nitroreductase